MNHLKHSLLRMQKPTDMMALKDTEVLVAFVRRYTMPKPTLTLNHLCHLFINTQRPCNHLSKMYGWTRVLLHRVFNDR